MMPSARTRILFLYPSATFDARWTVLTHILRHIPQDRYEATVCIDERAEGDPQLSSLPHVKVRKLSWYGAPVVTRGELGALGRVKNVVRGAAIGTGVFRELARLVRDERIDILHTCDHVRASSIGLALAAAGGARLVVHFHNTPAFYSPFDRRALGVIARSADLVVGVSRFNMETLRDLSVEDARLAYVVNGVDPSRFSPDRSGARVRAELGIADDETLVIQFARIVQVKRQEDLVRAMAIARKRAPKLKCAIIGWVVPEYSGRFANYREELEDIIRTEGLEATVRILPPRSDAPDVTAAADIIALPSIDDPCPLGVLEGLACGKPVITARSGGNPEMVTDESALLHRPADPADLADKLVELATSAERRRAMGRAGRAHVESTANDVRVSRDFVALYDRLASSPPLTLAQRVGRSLPPAS